MTPYTQEQAEALKDGIGAILLGTSVACINVSEGSEPCDHCGQCQRMKARRVMVAALAPEAPSESAFPLGNIATPFHTDNVGPVPESAGKPCAECGGQGWTDNGGEAESDPARPCPKCAPDSAAGGKANG